MNQKYEINIDIPARSSSPDTFQESGNEKPSKDFVVSRNQDGTIASVYGDYIWILTAYHPEKAPSKLNFKFWNNGSETNIRENLIEESRQILFSLMWIRNGPSLSIGTLRNYLTVVRDVCRYCETNSLTIHELFEAEKMLWKFVNSQESGWHIQTLGSMLQQLKNNKFGFIIVRQNMLQAIKARGAKYRETLNQHSPIPTRIYSEIISQLTSFTIEWEEVADSMLAITKVCTENPLEGRNPTNQFSIARKLNIPYKKSKTFPELLPSNCMDYFNQRNLSLNVKSLSNLIAEVQLALKLTIQTFSGMRDDEVFSLPYNCIKIYSLDGSEHYSIIGRTTKFNNGRKKSAKWITNVDGYKALQAAKKIAETIYSTFNIHKESLISESEYYPLFIPVGYLGLAGQTKHPENNCFVPSNIDLSRMHKLKKMVEPIILENDILELEQIDPHRAWRSEEKFQPGNSWSFTSHQLRRSLALYAQRSGLVSLPSLRRQLQHITNEMSLYYAKGSAYAKDFIGKDKEHFGTLWQKAKLESEGLSYILNVVFSDDILFGGHALWVKNKVIDGDGNISFDREKTLQQFKRGEIAYQETLLGGCTNTAPCTQSALKWINTECIDNGCKYLVCHVSKLDRVIAAQTKLVANIDESLLEYRTESSDLAILVNARERALKINSKG